MARITVTIDVDEPGLISTDIQHDYNYLKELQRMADTMGYQTVGAALIDLQTRLDCEQEI